jgi:glycosyltransferase involved in cell wall biosynthesis
VRLSSHRGLWWRTDGIDGSGAKLMIALERACVRRANLAYAPSRFVADECRASGWRSDVRVIRPPWFNENVPATASLSGLPSKYLLHFGQIGERKGSDALAAALPLAWREEPELCMIWAGTVIQAGAYERYQRLWGEKSTQIVWLGTVPKDRMYALLQHAQATVLPSRVDNLPNTVIESLMMGIPVLGFAGGSVDELVESGVNGELVPLDDVEGLARTMVRAWRRNAAWLGPGHRRTAVLDEIEPQTAVTRLLRVFEEEIRKLTA